MNDPVIKRWIAMQIFDGFHAVVDDVSRPLEPACLEGTLQDKRIVFVILRYQNHDP